MSSTLPASRRQGILDRVLQDGEAQVGALAEEIGVSAITIRRDIAALAGEGRLEQVRGGARRIAAEVSRPPATSPGSGPRVALVVPSLRYYWPSIIQGATDAARGLHLDLAVHASTGHAETQFLVVEQIAADPGVDALIIAPELREGPASEALVQQLAALRIPVILAERGIEEHGTLGRSFDSVRTDHSLGAARAVRLLHDLGHRRIAYEGTSSSPSQPFVAAGYERAARLHGLPESAARRGVLNPNKDQPFEAIDEALGRYREDGVTGVLVHSDSAAVLLLQHARRNGWSVPDDLSLIAYDDELSVTTTPALTAVSPAKRELGARSVALALQRLEHPESPVEHVMLVPRLQIRETTKALA